LTPALLAALLTVAAYAVGTAPSATALRLRSLVPPAGPAAVPPHAPPHSPPRRPPPVIPLGAALAGYVLGPRLAVVALLASYAVRAVLRRHAAAARSRAIADALPDICRATAAELRTGATPFAALARAAEDAPPELAAHLRRLAALSAHGPAPPAEAWAALPGAERLRAVGALWRVVTDAGNGLADGLDRLAGSLAAERRQRADLAAKLAGPKASAAVLAALPLCGIALAAVLGARPFAFLTGTPAGAACLVAGVGLDAAGLIWVRRLTARASP
jgi:tight adherence protein B